MANCRVSPTTPGLKRALDGDRDDGGKWADGWGGVLLHTHQPPQDVISVPGPAVNVRVLKPSGDMTLLRHWPLLKLPQSSVIG